MTDEPSDDPRKEAFALYEEGRYQESIRVCTRTPGDASLAILVAKNLVSLGEYEEAEAQVRDLLVKMPESSYLHSFLGGVLAARGADGAIAEYAEAIQLDPGNEEALRAYSAYFTGSGDHRSAIPLLSALARLSGKREDAIALVRSLIEAGEGEEALLAYEELLGGTGADVDYIDALMVAGRHREAAAASINAFRERRDPTFLRQYLAAVAAFDRKGALKLFPHFLKDCPDDDLAFDHVLLLKSEGHCREALERCEALIARNPHPIYQLVACELIAATGSTDLARQGYEGLIGEEMHRMDDPESLGMVIEAYEGFLRKTLNPTTVPPCYLATVSSDANVVSLIRTGLFYASFGQTTEAAEWLYRAYRLDFLNGGIEYARFLAGQGEMREYEKVLMHILSNIKRDADLVRVAEAVIDAGTDWKGMRRLIDALIDRFSAAVRSLGPGGIEVFARIYLRAAEEAFSVGEYARCKECSLRGLDMARKNPEIFFDLIRRCKEATVAERPALPLRNTKPSGPLEETAPDLGLDEREEALVAFLRQHRESNEEELRKVLGTRRVSGAINRLIRKASDAGVTLIEKRGMGEHGEVYIYCGK
ncbi:tetratricopeptide repeat protein [Methanofollis tationis]|uniref:Tetratricopeptide repeat protein n=1 Tax=Methanofollis tationis TaxID=81417 RepID=A0A7K4HRU6_9EURY|nr:tetratricopeptide repeat protein [Methanofollis tationis]NVO67578.1 hypothetical protein [Methanofollis tationis]